ncbi:histidine phosphatase family protein [Tissierella sp. MSJ-40]|uniref:Histidine phosphatase family protein n=1 Tax=Tissierella simiarum TaxID=2841534 RepID=A0ABS6E3C8_9FIRM|nr:histidine phosphatase family protein [Tissierella simiarum]MBU5437416.1 histidine phosphatase family protein [Tissierella simiarum]
MNIYLTRHGQTEWNTQGRLQGWQNSPLTEKGRKDAKLLGERLSKIPLDIIYSSSSQRALDTAKIIKGNRNIETIIDDNLREINMGPWEGRILEEIEKENPVEYFNYWNAPHLYVPLKGGEYFEDVQKRSVAVIDKIIKEGKYKNVLVVTHGITLKNILNYYDNKAMENLWDTPFIQGTSLSKIEVRDEGIHVPFFGDTSHLE